MARYRRCNRLCDSVKHIILLLHKVLYLFDVLWHKRCQRFVMNWLDVVCEDYGFEGGICEPVSLPWKAPVASDNHHSVTRLDCINQILIANYLLIAATDPWELSQSIPEG